MYRIEAKPLTVNQCWCGKRFKTPKYKAYEVLILSILPDEIDIPEGELEITLEWGFSSAASDWDNPIKPFQDILQKKYDFNDNRIHSAIVTKQKTKRGEEYISFEIRAWKKN